MVFIHNDDDIGKQYVIDHYPIWLRKRDFREEIIDNEEVCIELPEEYEYTYKVLKLIKSVYVIERDPLNWFNKLSWVICICFLDPINYDPCIFFRERVNCLV